MKKFMSMILVIITVFALAVPAMAAVQNVPQKTAKAIGTIKVYSGVNGSETGKTFINNADVPVTFNLARLNWASVSGGVVKSSDLLFSIPDLGRALFGNNTLKKGDTGNAIQNIKRALNRDGWDLDYNNNSFGGTLENTIKAFQSEYGLKADGIIGAATKDALLYMLLGTTDLYNTLG